MMIEMNDKKDNQDKRQGEVVPVLLWEDESVVVVVATRVCCCCRCCCEEDLQDDSQKTRHWSLVYAR